MAKNYAGITSFFYINQQLNLFGSDLLTENVPESCHVNIIFLS